MEIRHIEPSEFDELGALTVDVYIADGHLTFGAGDPYVPELRDVARRAREADVLVAVEDGVVLGGVTYASSHSPWADLAGPGEADVRMLVVRHSARGRGIGEALVQACIDRARGHRLQRLVLSNSPTQTAGRHIYLKLGFVAVPSRDWRPDPAYPELVLNAYELRL